MRRLFLAMSLALPLPAVAADVRGVWKTNESQGQFAVVEIAACGAQLCGYVREAYEGSTKLPVPAVAGPMLVIEPDGIGEYQGKIFHPHYGRSFPAHVSNSETRLKVKGCAVGGLVCETQVWTRIR